MFVSVAFSETGSVRGVSLRSFWTLVFLGAVFSSAKFLSVWVEEKKLEKLGDVAMASPKYQEQIAVLEGEKNSYEKQVKVFAHELGVLQARLDRFDAISERLFSDPDLGAHLEDVEELDGKGSAVILEEMETPSIEELEGQISLLRKHTDKVDTLMQAGMQLLASKEMGADQKPSVWPAVHKRTRVSSHYGYRHDPFGKKKGMHGGTDLTGSYNAPIVSAADGVVVFSGYRYNYGILVEVRHAGGFTTRYAHLNEGIAKNGQKVKAGELIGLMGSTGRSTGPHLHFELLIGDTKVDPYPFIRDGKMAARDIAKKYSGENLISFLKN